jgi:hypothetical protein
LGDELLVTVRGVDMDKRTIDLAMAAAGTATGQIGPDKAYIAPSVGQWDETRPQSRSAGEQKSFGKGGKKAASEARERQRRSLGKKKKRR